MDHSQEIREGRGNPEGDQGPTGFDDAPQSLPSIGDYLTGQRQLRGISRQELCDLTRIPLRSLERLESGVFDQMDDGFVRGFVRTVAESLGLDPDDTLARITQEPVSMDQTQRTIPLIGLMRVGVLVAGFALVLISVGLISLAVQYVPGQQKTSPLVMRRDPVRVLAEARGGSGITARQALVTPEPPRSPPATWSPDPPPTAGESLRVELRALER